MEDSDLKIREQWLRDEVRNHRTTLFSLIQWAVTLLAGIESALYFIRRDIANAMIGKQVVPAEVLSFAHWIYGTILITVVALAFSLLYLNLVRRYWSYREQLSAAAALFSKMKDSALRKNLTWVILLFFWAFPIIDVAVWLTFHKKA
jgi:hypothetical protein